MSKTYDSESTQATGVASWLTPLGFFVVAALFYSINLDYPPKFDELYHVLGAIGFIEHGAPRIAEGYYERVRLFTSLIALMFQTFGESVTVARIPSVICGALLVSLVFVWTRYVAGTFAAWATTVLLMLSPLAVEVFQYARFYAPQSLFFFVGCVSTYAAATSKGGWPPRIGWSILALISMIAAVYLQVVTLIGIAGVGIWVAVFLGVPWLKSMEPRRRMTVIIAGIVVFALALALILLTVGPWAWAIYNKAPVWAMSRRHMVWFYHFFLNLYYPSIWPLFPLVALAAICHKARPALFCFSIFATAMLLHAFAASKALIYAFYMMPFMFVLFGMAIAQVGPAIVNFARNAMKGGLQAVGLPPETKWRYAVYGMIGAFILIANTASVRTATMLAGITVPPEVPHADWQGVAPQLHEAMDRSDVVITANELHQLYYVGEYDILLGRSRMFEMREKREFVPDHRTGRAVISVPESINEVIGCFADGLFIIESARWRNNSFVSTAMADVIVDNTVPFELPPSSRIQAFEWSGRGENADSSACTEIRKVKEREVLPRDGRSFPPTRN